MLQINKTFEYWLCDLKYLSYIIGFYMIWILRNKFSHANLVFSIANIVWYLLWVASIVFLMQWSEPFPLAMQIENLFRRYQQ